MGSAHSVPTMSSIMGSAHSPPIGQTIWLQTTNTNTYVSARTDKPNVPVQATATKVQDWEKFDVVDAGNGLIALRAHANNGYVSARIDQKDVPLHVQASQVLLYEQFSWLTQSNGTIALKSAASNKYISARSDQGDTPLKANITVTQGWEQFRWGLVTPPNNVYVVEHVHHLCQKCTHRPDDLASDDQREYFPLGCIEGRYSCSRPRK